MSEENISDDELTALFGDDEENDGGDGPPVEDSGGGSSPSEDKLIKTHDWGEKRRLSTDQMRTLNDLHDQFAKSYGPALSISMKRQVDIRLSEEPRQTTYGEFIADLDYEKDSSAEVDLNLVLNDRFEILEIQGTAEQKPFSKEDLDKLFDMTKDEVNTVFDVQKNV